MITATWDWLWDKHYQMKDLLSFFVKPNASKMGTKADSVTASGSSSIPSQKSGNNGDNKRDYKTAQLFGLILGPLLFLLILLFFTPEGLSYEGRAVLAGTTWIAIWWMTEALPIPVTSLLPIILFPLTNALSISETDRKSTRLNSSHVAISYAGFCLKKKKVQK